MKNDRLGMLLIVASLVAIAIISGFLYKHQHTLHEDKIRVQGVALTRALSSVDPTQLLSGNNKTSFMNNLIEVQANEGFAYVIIVNTAGEKLYENTSAGSIAPLVAMPTKPYAWFGEHNVTSPGDGRKVREFYAPIMNAGALAGFVRVGYYNMPTGMSAGEISYLGLMALPVFLLTTLSYFLIRREIRPLTKLSEKIDQASLSYGIQPVTSTNTVDLNNFIQRFDQFIQLVQDRASQMGGESVSAQTTAHLLTYKQEKAESALNSIPDAVMVIDDTCVTTYANPKIEPILGIKREEIIGRPPQDWCNNKDVLTFIMKFKNSPSVMRLTNMEYMPEENSDKRISVSAFPLFSPRDQNTLLGMLILFRDITKEHQAMHAGAEYVSHISHELKTPLNTLATYSELLLDYATLAEGERVDAVNIIHSEVDRIANLVNNLLNISKIETGAMKLNRKRVKIQDLLENTFDYMRSQALGKGISLDLQLPSELGSVRLDKDMFRIAINNLVTNAIKYSDAGSTVTLGARILDDEQMQISVKDQGIGISSEDQAKIFLKYYRASNENSASRSGHGLGLYLAKQIIEMHHGVITVNSEIGKGTEFTVTFKAQPVQLEESLAA